MISAQVVETSVTITDNSPSQDLTQLNDQTTLSRADLVMHMTNCSNSFVFCNCNFFTVLSTAAHPQTGQCIECARVLP